MSKGNLFLGQARGSVGDVVFYVANGQQIARARNRRPANPKTDKQLIQRCIAASVQRMYSLGQAIFNHSFEGLRPGEANQREFVSRNMSLLRGLIVAEINDDTAEADCVARIGAPGINIAVPFDGMQVSNGSYQQNLFAWDNENYGFKLPAANSGETIGEYATRVGLVPGDIYTFGSIASDPSVYNPMVVASDTAYGKLYRFQFAFSQLKVKDSVIGSTSLMNAALFSTLFEVVGGLHMLDHQEYNVVIDLDHLGAYASEQGCLFCIRSRWGEDLRSTSFLKLGRATAPYGLTSNYLVDVWDASSDLNQQDLVLEGKDF